MSMYMKASTANKFPKAKSGGKAGTVRGVTSPSPQFSQLSGVTHAKGGSRNSGQPRVGYQRA